MKKLIFIVGMFYQIMTAEGGTIHDMVVCYPDIHEGYIETEYDYYLSLYPESDQYIIKNAHYKYQIPVKYLYRLHYIESKHNQSAIRHESNGSTSIGYSQLNDSNADYFAVKFNDGEAIDFFDKKSNIMMGAAYLRYLYDWLGDWQMAFQAYNCGVGRVLQFDIPQMSYEYSLAIMYGDKYIDQIVVIYHAVEGIL